MARLPQRICVSITHGMFFATNQRYRGNKQASSLTQFDFFLIVSLISAKTTSDRNDAVDGRHDAVFAVAVGPARYGEGNHSSELLLVLVVVCCLLET